MNREEIIQAKDKLNHCIEFYENMCEPREVQPILTGEEKKALKSLLRYNDNLEQQCKKQKEIIDKANKKLNNFIGCCKAEKLESGSDYIHHQYWDMFERFNKQIKDILKKVSE